jgi:hypothetical protein
VSVASDLAEDPLSDDERSDGLEVHRGQADESVPDDVVLVTVQRGDEQLCHALHMQLIGHSAHSHRLILLLEQLVGDLSGELPLRSTHRPTPLAPTPTLIIITVIEQLASCTSIALWGRQVCHSHGPLCGVLSESEFDEQQVDEVVHELQEPLVDVIALTHTEEETRDETRGDDVADDMDAKAEDILVDEDDESGHLEVDVFHGLR